MAKGNLRQQNAFRTQCRGDVHSALERVREAARKNKGTRFTALFHYVYDLDMLKFAFFRLKKEAAPGVDGEKWRNYVENLEANLQDLSPSCSDERITRSRCVGHTYEKRRAAAPARRDSFEGQIVQRAAVEVLNAIYEEDFADFSYGFRLGRSQHKALDHLYLGIHGQKMNWVLDLDIRSFFDTLSLNWLVKFVEHRIGDGASCGSSRNG